MRVDTLFYNGNFYISRGMKKPVHWLAVSDGRVVSYGEGRARGLMAKRKINLDYKRVMPGWIDAHAHLYNLGMRTFEIDLSRCESKMALLHILKRRLHHLKSQYRNPDWIEAYGLNTNQWQVEPAVDLLDQVSSSVPIVVRRVDEHAIWVNSAALELARIGHETADPKGGKIVRDERGRITGALLDKAMERVLDQRPLPPEKTLEEAFGRAQASLLKRGITSVHDMSMRRLPLEALSLSMRRDRFKCRVYAALYGKDTWEAYPAPTTSMFENRLQIRAKKIFMDGALGSRGAWLSHPYQDAPGWQGISFYNRDELLAMVQDALRRRFQLVFHTMGDQASRSVLETIASRYRPIDLRSRRFRFEHLEVIDPRIFSMMKRFGIVASVQPWHVLSDSPWLLSRIGKERSDLVLPLKMMMRAKLHLCGGSDAPIDNYNPLAGIFAAVTRSPLSQRILLEDAVQKYTEGAAYAEFSEHLKGTLERGRLAEFCVLSEDIFSIESSRFSQVKNLMTVVGGEVLYEA